MACCWAIGCAKDTRTVLTVYTPHGKELLSDFEQRFERDNPTIDVQWVDMGSQEVLDRLRAEAANPQADVWFGAPSDMFERAAREGLLEPYTPSWSGQVSEDMHDAQDRWFGTYLTPEVIGYNREALTVAQAPKDWNDIVAPQWKGKIVLRDPIASGTMRAIFGAILQRSLRETGSTQAGFDWLRKLDGNTKEYALNPTILYQKLGRREGVVTLYNMPDMATLEQRTKIPVAYTVPTSGTPVLVDGIALVKGSAHADVAKRYYEFVTSREASLIAARTHLRIPVRRDLPQDSLPAWVQQARTSITVMPLDRGMMADSLDGWMRYWDANIRNRYRGK
jgi:iron(III) transport system substrate-binding protein